MHHNRTSSGHIGDYVEFQPSELPDLWTQFQEEASTTGTAATAAAGGVSPSSGSSSQRRQHPAAMAAMAGFTPAEVERLMGLFDEFLCHAAHAAGQGQDQDGAGGDVGGGGGGGGQEDNESGGSPKKLQCSGWFVAHLRPS